MKKLNLGAGEFAIAGYEARDAKTGDVLWPLPDADASCDEIRASHVLEHFAHGQVAGVLAEWVRALKPGGQLKIAVPDLRFIAGQYLSGGSELPLQGYLMGGQTDRHDFHKAVFDAEMLAQLLRQAGLVAIKRWKSEIADCASLPVSLNLCGFKTPEAWPKVSAVISMPRLGFNDFWACAYQELAALNIPLRKMTGAYWDRDLSFGLQGALDDDDPEWILTADYDTVFTRHQVRDLLSIATRYPHADAIAPIQAARHHDSPLFTVRAPDGRIVHEVERDMIVQGELLKVESAHFGLTLIRAAKLKALAKPWFSRKYDEQGWYGEAGCDPDVNFWRQWKAAGNTLYTALRVPVGHCELMVRWPNLNLDTTFQRPSEFWKTGTPDDIWR